MPRIRSLKPDVWDDEAVGEVSIQARLLFIGLITQADDDGYLPGNPKWIDSKVFPYDDSVALEHITGWVGELAEAGLIKSYEVEGKPYIWLPNWGKHQSIDKRYYTASKLPRVPVESPTSAPREPAEATTPDRRGEEGIGEDRKSPVEPGDAPLSDLLADLVAANDPNGKRPTVSKAWRDAEDRMLRLDGREPEEAERLIRWTQADEFWRVNVLSMPKFREQYGRLYNAAVLAAEKRKPKGSPGMAQAHRFAEKARQAKAEEEAAHAAL